MANNDAIRFLKQHADVPSDELVRILAEEHQLDAIHMPEGSTLFTFPDQTRLRIPGGSRAAGELLRLMGWTQCECSPG